MKKIITLILLVVGFVGQASAYYSLPGSWDGWNKPKNQFVNNEVIIFLEGGLTYEFKFHNSESNDHDGYSGNDGTIVNSVSNWEFTKDANCKLITSISGEYTFTLSWNGSIPRISVTYPTASTYSRSVTSGNYGTICLPYGATVEGATVFEITSKIGNMEGINLQSVTNLVAGRAYIFKATSSKLTATLTEDKSSEIEANCMKGNFSPTSVNVPTNCYIVKDNQIRKVVEGGVATVGQYRAYITNSVESLNAGARGSYFIDFEDELSGIETIGCENSQHTVYNLQGQRVMDNQKGLLIVNGKKILR